MKSNRTFTILPDIALLMTALAVAVLPAGYLSAQESKVITTDDASQELKVIREPDIFFVPTPQAVVDQMLELIKPKEGDLIYDLGCGDGRFVVTAASKYGCRGIGYDIDPVRVIQSIQNARTAHVEHLVRIEQKDIFTVDFSDASAITLYLLPRLNVQLIPQLEKLKPGTRIVSHDFDMQGVVEPDSTVSVVDDEGDYHSIFMWITPLKKK